MTMRTRIMALVVAGASGVAMAQQDQPGRPGEPRPMPGQPAQPGQPGMPGRDTTMRPGMTQDQGKKLTSAQVQEFTQGWDQEKTEAIRTLTSRYGQPSEGTPSMIIWKDPKPTGAGGDRPGFGDQPGGDRPGGLGEPRQPGGIGEPDRPGQPGMGTSGGNNFKRIVVYRNSVPHRFPKQHDDFLEFVVSYKVPADKVSDLIEFDGSLVYHRTRGELSAFCHKEEANILALNLAHDIVTGSKDVNEAREEMSRLAMQIEQGQKPREATQLAFRPDPSAADPGTPARVLGAPEDQDDDKKENLPGKPGDLPKKPGGDGSR